MHTTNDPALLQAHINQLTHATDIAALCIIDLRANLQRSEDDFMSGNISHQDHQNVLIRFRAMLDTLHRAGYTDTHPVINIPKRPSE